MAQISVVRWSLVAHSFVSAVTVGAVIMTAAWGRAEPATGVWTLQKTLPGGSPWETAANWQGGYVPTNAHDSATLAAVYNDTNDRSADWMSTSSIFVSSLLPKATTELVLDNLSGYREHRLWTPLSTGNLYSLIDVNDYLGRVVMRLGATLRIRAEESGVTQRLAAVDTIGAATLQVDGGRVELGMLKGSGTLSKTGMGDLALAGVTGAGGVKVKLAANSGKLELGSPAVPTVVEGAAIHIDASRTDTMTITEKGVERICDVRGAAYHSLNADAMGNKPQLVPYGDKTLLSFGGSSEDADSVAKYGPASMMVCDATIENLKTFFVVYRYNRDVGGHSVFPINDETGYAARLPLPPSSYLERRYDMFSDYETYHLFKFQQYSAGDQCFMPHAVLSGDIRRNGEPVIYNETPRGFGPALECLSFNVDTNALQFGAINQFNFRYLCRRQNEGKSGGSQIAEFIGYTTQLTDAQQKQVNSYLMRKWLGHEGQRDWEVGAVASQYGVTIDVPAGKTAYVKTIDTTRGAVVKTGGGTLKARYVKGAGFVDVRGGSVEMLAGKAAEVDLAREPAPAPGIALRFDASSDPATYMTVVAENGTNFVERWNSTVTANKQMKDTLYNNYLAIKNGNCATYPAMRPFLATEGGKTWMDFGELAYTGSVLTDTPKSAYMRFTKEDGSGDYGANYMKEAFWVWKPRKAADKKNPVVLSSGGGYGSGNPWWRYFPNATDAILASKSNYSAGDGNDNTYKMVANSQWAVNGRTVDPLTENYPDGVQVVRVSMNQATYSGGLGNENNYTRGGFQLGELIVYARELTDRERVETEAYLMKKWMDAEHPDRSGAAEALTRATYAAATSVAATEGVVQVSELPAAEQPPEFLAGAHTHFDASDLSSFNYTIEPGTGDIVIDHLYDTRRNGQGAWPSHSNTLYNNRPKLRLGHLNGRSVIDLGTIGTAAANDGSSTDLRLDKMCETKSAILVYANRESDKWTSMLYYFNGSVRPVWQNGGATSFFSSASEQQAYNSTVYVDGVKLAQPLTTAGTAYPVGFHVMALEHTGGNTTSACWSYGVSGFADDASGQFGGMLLAEAYLFTNQITAAQRALGEEYLMKKWGLAGRSFSGKPALQSVSAAKGATVRLQQAVTATMLSGGGTVDVSAVDGVAALDVSLFKDGPECVTVSGEVTLAEAGKVRITLVDAAAKVVPGRYAILTAGAFAADVAEKFATWTLEAPTLKNRTLELMRIGETIYIDVIPSGFTILIR